MLTLYDNIKLRTRRYNKKRGSAMLLVLMSMAIIMVVGSSMLFVTLSSFSTSIADTQQTRAQSACLTISENIKENVNALISAYVDDISKATVESPYTMKFLTETVDSNLETEWVETEYTTINGVRVSVTMLPQSTDKAGDLSSVLVNVTGTYRGQTSTLRFTIDNKSVTTSTTIEDTFGNAFVVSGSMGNVESRDPTQTPVFLRIEGDVSIDCTDDYTDEAGQTQERMSTRVFNPIVVEGVTGSIYANGDLIIGSSDNILKVQGNIYVDGNLIIRGLDLGVQLAAIYKSDYSDSKKPSELRSLGTFVCYRAIRQNREWYQTELSPSVSRVIGTSNAWVGDVMYGVKGGKYVPMQIYEENTHYILADRGITSFFSPLYDSNGNVVSIVEIAVGSEPNEAYYGAQLYELGTTSAAARYASPSNLAAVGHYVTNLNMSDLSDDMISQYPMGGNLYVSGDIIYDTYNYGNTQTFLPDDTKTNGLLGSVFHPGNTLQVEYLTMYEKTVSALNNDLKSATVKNQTLIRGDIFCFGRMIVDPMQLNASEIEGNKVTNLTLGETISKYLGGTSTITTERLNANNSFSAANFRNAILAEFKKSSLVTSAQSYKYSYNPFTIYQRRSYAYADVADYYKYFVENNGVTTAAIQKSITDAVSSRETSLNGSIVDWLKSQNINGLLGLTAYSTSGIGTNGSNQVPSLIDLNMPQFSQQTNIYINNYAGVGTGFVDGVGNGIDTGKVIYDDGSNVTTEFARKLNEIKVIDPGTKNSIVTNCETAEGQIVTASTTTRYGKTYYDGLYAKFVQFNINSLYVAGTVQLVSSKLYGYEAAASLKVNDKAVADNAYSSEFGVLSLKDLLTVQHQNDAYDKTKFEEFDDYIEYLMQSYFSTTRNNEALDDTVLNYNMGVTLGYDSSLNKQWGLNPTIVKPTVLIRAHKRTSFNNGFDGSSNDTSKDELRVFGDILFSKDTVFVAKYSYLNGGTSIVPDWQYGFKEDSKFQLSSSTSATTLISQINGVLNSDAQLSAIEQNLIIALVAAYKNDNVFMIDKLFIMDYDTCTLTQNSNILTGLDLNVAVDYDTIEDFVEKTMFAQQYVTMFSNKLEGVNSIYSTYVTNAYSGLEDSKNKLRSGGATTGFSSIQPFFFKEYGLLLRQSVGTVFDGGPSRIDASGSYVGTVQDVFEAMHSPFFAAVNVTAQSAISAEYVDELVRDEKVTEYNSFVDVKGNYDSDTLMGQSNALKDAKINLSGYEEFKPNLIDYRNQIAGNGYFNTPSSVAGLDNVWCWAIYWEYNGVFIDSAYYDVVRKKGTDTVMNKLLTFYNNANKNIISQQTGNIKDSLYCDDTFTSDPLRTNANSDLFAQLSSNYRSQVEYTINKSVYFNFSGKSGNWLSDGTYSPQDNGGFYSAKPYDRLTNTGGAMQFGVDNEGVSSMRANRMYIKVDTTEGDVFIYINAPSANKNSSEAREKYGVLFQKCSFQVTGDNNCYIVLVEDTSISANAFSWEVVTDGDKGNKNDEYVGTHFYSDYYYSYHTQYADKNVGNFLGFSQNRVIGMYDGTYTEVGDLFIIGTGDNTMRVGRGGMINGFVYLPNGTYLNETVGLLNILPVASSASNSATIVAKNVQILGSNVGKLIFNSFTQNVSSGAGNNSTSGLDDLFSETQTTITESVYTVKSWVFGNYLYA